MQNHKLQTLKVVQNKRDLILNFEQKVIKETKIMKNGKIIVFGALTEEFTKVKVHLVARWWLLIKRLFPFS